MSCIETTSHNSEMPADSGNASLHWGDVLRICCFWPLLGLIRTERPMQVLFDQHNRRETACAGLQTLCCVATTVACMQQNSPSPLVCMSVLLALLQGFCRHSKPRPDPIPAGCAGHPGKNKRVIWMVARQHPGEAMAEWFIEGFLDRLTDPHDGASMRVLEHAVFYVVGIVSSPDQSLLYCMLHAAGIVSYHTGNGQLVNA